MSRKTEVKSVWFLTGMQCCNLLTPFLLKLKSDKRDKVLWKDIFIKGLHRGLPLGNKTVSTSRNKYKYNFIKDSTSVCEHNVYASIPSFNMEFRLPVNNLGLIFNKILFSVDNNDIKETSSLKLIVLMCKNISSFEWLTRLMAESRILKFGLISKAELLQLNLTQFPSLGIFVSKKVGNRKN